MKFIKVFILALISSMMLITTYTANASIIPGRYSNAFYAIQSSGEKDYTLYADQVALGWSEIRRKNDIIYFTDQKREVRPALISEYGVPDGDVAQLVNDMKSQGNKLMLSVFLVNTKNENILRDLLDSVDTQNKIISDMIAALDGIKTYNYNSSPNDKGVYPSNVITDSNGTPIEYDGIVIDFEQLYDSYEDKPGISYRDKLTAFIKKLKDNMPKTKTLSFVIPPKRQIGIDYFDGYDYERIGAIADEIILMAHDYQAKDGSIRATAPYKYVKEAIEFAVSDIPKEKILLHISLGPVQWRDGDFYRPSYQSMINALEGKNLNEMVIEATPPKMRFDPVTKSGYAYLKREMLNTTTEQKIIEDEFYYENALSVAYKRHLAIEYELKGLSLWRLGLGVEDALNQFFDVVSDVPADSSQAAMPDETLYDLIEPVSGSTVSGEKVWRVNFSSSVDPRTLQKGIEIWKREGNTWVKQNIYPIVDSNNDKSVLIKTVEAYTTGEYRLFMNNSIFDIRGRNLKKGIMMKFYVKR